MTKYIVHFFHFSDIYITGVSEEEEPDLQIVMKPTNSLSLHGTFATSINLDSMTHMKSSVNNSISRCRSINKHFSMIDDDPFYESNYVSESTSNAESVLGSEDSTHSSIADSGSEIEDSFFDEDSEDSFFDSDSIIEELNKSAGESSEDEGEDIRYGT